MTKAEAIWAMRAGEKVTHRYFSKGEGITIKDNRVLTEDHVTVSVFQFFHDRQGEQWEADWSIYNPQNINK